MFQHFFFFQQKSAIKKYSIIFFLFSLTFPIKYWIKINEFFKHKKKLEGEGNFFKVRKLLGNLSLLIIELNLRWHCFHKELSTLSWTRNSQNRLCGNPQSNFISTLQPMAGVKFSAFLYNDATTNGHTEFSLIFKSVFENLLYI